MGRGVEDRGGEVLSERTQRYEPRAGGRTRRRRRDHGLARREDDYHIHVFDAKALIERPATKRQKLAIIDEIGKRQGFVLTQLGFRSGEEINPLLQYLDQACQERNKPFEFRESESGL